jgi:replication factor C subunit 3/5
MMDVEISYDKSNQFAQQNKKIEDLSKLPFIEKYRPKTLKEMVSHEDIISTLNLFKEKKSLPHLLFHGPPGTGKTSCILAIAREMYGDSFKNMVLELNASDDRGISVVREKIRDFCNSQGLLSKGTKLVILDECDMMTSVAQFALRRLIERFTKNARFCLICNQVSKIIPAIQSRCMRFRFSPLKQEQCKYRLEEICYKEGIETDIQTIEKIIDIGQGDMRKILNILESTFMSYSVVNTANVYACTGLPSEEEINYIIRTVHTKSFEEAFTEIQTVKNEKGYSMDSLVLEVLKKVRKINQMPIKSKIIVLKKFQKLDLLNNMGGSESIILSNLLMAIKDFKSL